MNKIVFLIIVSLSQTCFGFSCPPDPDNTEPCKQRPGARYKHIQCAVIDFRFHYKCLNHKNIDESAIANSKIYDDKPSNRVNYFEYFPETENKTHIMCGNDGLKKSCYLPNIKTAHCKKGASDTIGKQISQLDVCLDFHFAGSNNFTIMDGIKSACK